MSLNYLFLYIIILFLIIVISKFFNFYDIPSSRKIHKNKVINTGGASIFLFHLLIISTTEFDFSIELIVVYGSIVFLGGFIDDRINLNPATKLIFIFIPTIFLVLTVDNFILKDIGYYEEIGWVMLGKFSFIFTVLCVVLLINSLNYIDGVDGLALINILISIIFMSLLVKDENFYKIIYLLSLPILINFLLNIVPLKSGVKIFSGDCGSLYLGFLLSFLIIYVYNVKNIHPSYLIWSIWYPIYDFLFVTLNRIYKGKKFFTPGRDHLHHYYLKKFNDKHFFVMICVSAINIFIIFLGYYINLFFGNSTSIVLFIFLFIFYFLFRKKIFI